MYQRKDLGSILRQFKWDFDWKKKNTGTISISEFQVFSVQLSLPLSTDVSYSFVC